MDTTTRPDGGGEPADGGTAPGGPPEGGIAWPRSTAQLRDAHLTPDDFTPVTGPITRQGIDLRDPRVAQAFHLGAQAADMLDERARLLQAARLDAWRAEQARLRRLRAHEAYLEQTASRADAGADRQAEAAAAQAHDEAAAQARADDLAAGAAASPDKATTGAAQADAVDFDATAPSATPATPAPAHDEAAAHEPHATPVPPPPQPADMRPGTAPIPSATGIDAPSTSSGAAPIPGAPGTTMAPPVPGIVPNAAPPAPRRSGIQVLLLVLGIGLITTAVLVFATIAYAMLGDAGRATCIGVVGVGALAGAWALTDRLRVTAEGLAWGGLAALVIDAFMMGATGLIPTPSFGMAAPPGWTLPTGVLLMLIAAAAFGLRMLPVRSRRPLRAFGCFAVFALPLGAFETAWAFHTASFDLSLPAAFTAACATATLIAAFMPRLTGRRMPDFEWLASLIVAGATLMASMISHVGGATYSPAPGVLLATLAAALACAAGMLAIMRRRTLMAAVRPRHPLPAVPMPPLPAAVPWMSGPAGAAAAPGAAQPMPHPMARPAMPMPPAFADPAPMTPTPGTSTTPYPARPAPVGPTPGTPTLVERPLGNGWRVLPWIAIMLGAAPLSKSTQLLMESAMGLESPWPRTVGDLVAVLLCGAAALAACLLRRGWSGAERITAGVTGSALLFVIASADWTWWHDYRDYRLMCAWAAFVLLVATMTAAWIMGALLPPRPDRNMRRTMCTGLVPMPSGVPGEPPVMVQAMVVVPPPADDHAAERQTNTALRWTIGSVAALSTLVLWGLATGSPQQPPFPGEAPATLFGLAALAIGGTWLARRQELRSWPALSVGLALTLLPSLMMSWSDSGSVALARAIVLGTVAVLAIVWGALRGLQAPLLAGAIVLPVHVLTQMWPLLAEFSRSFWWVWLALGGVVLVVAAARYEHSINSMRRAALRFSQLR